MRYINSAAYVQYKIDTILQDVHMWARIYINNIICRVTLVQDLLDKLQI